ncbi:MAG: hypothetical protein KFH87_14880 [Bacteroidetes bacterium]|nr:hypothetical protein [Bacteroidota bacterium]
MSRRIPVLFIMLVCSCVFAVVASAQSDPPWLHYTPTQSVVAPSDDDGGDMPLTDEHQSLQKAMLPPVYIPGVVLRPTIDGVISPGEWTGALELTMTSPVPHLAPMGSKVWMFNDACYLYVAASIPTPMYNSIRYAGDASMLNIWFDLDADGVWDNSSPPDGNLAIPAPGYQFPRERASFLTYATQQLTFYTNALFAHVPWWVQGQLLSESDVFVRTSAPTPEAMYMEARIDIRYSPLRLTMGQAVNMRVQSYGGYYNLTQGGTVLITGYWPYVGSPASGYFYGNYANTLEPVVPAVVVPEPDPYDILSASVADNPLFGAKAYVIGSNINIEIEYEGFILPKTGDYILKIYGPLPSETLVETITGTFDVTQSFGTVLKTLMVNLTRGFYKFELFVTDPDECGVPYYFSGGNFLMLAPGETPCVVWPGDVNRDDVVNYTDRASLNDYIFESNLRSTWLNGPFRAAPVSGALAGLAWMPQVALPWATDDGCHMDTDGNGLINNFDYIAMKINWMKSVSTVPPKRGERVHPASCMLEQNYPNPFNPSTTLTYRISEASRVTLRITDVSGREVARLVERDMDAGVFTATFDAEQLPGGSYYAMLQVTGHESGIEYNRMVKMLLIK